MHYVESVLADLKKRNPWETEFLQAAEEMLETLKPAVDANPEYAKHKILERIVEPERVISFTVTWLDDNNQVQVNRGWRVQYNSAVGPYKGGLRFHPSVNLSILRFLGFEQIFKNALTGLGIGGGKGGSDFDPKGKSEFEVMRFCQAFMTELTRHVGPTIDVPAGDIGVGGREVGYMFGQYKRLTTSFAGVLTGKPLPLGGSLARKEATGYGTVYFAHNMLEAAGKTLAGRKCAVSGAGNVAIYCVEKLIALGATPITVSDSRGTIHQPNGINVEVLKQVREVERASLTRYAELMKDATYIPVANYPTGGHAAWHIPCAAAFPCATQNELTLTDAKALLANGCDCVAEGSNMSSTLEALHTLVKAKIHYGPSKAVNAGGVATSQLEMAQNASMQRWTFDEVDAKLQAIMANIHRNVHEAAKDLGEPANLVTGANVSAFRQVADAMIAQGVC